MATFAELLDKLTRQASSRDATTAVETCPKKHKPAIFVMLVDLETAEPVSGVEVDVGKPTSQKKKTGSDGLAKFDPAKPGRHTVRFLLSGDLADKYAPLPVQQALAGGDTTAALFIPITPFPTVQVTVERTDDSKGVGDAQVELVEVGGTKTRKETSKPNSGQAVFQHVKPGLYEIRVSFAEDVYQKLQKPAPIRKTISAGQSLTVKVPVAPRGKVDPVLTIAAPKLVLVKRPYMDTAGSGIKAHRLAVQVGTTARFDGTGRLLCSSTTKLKLFDSAEGGNEKKFPLALAASHLNQTHDQPGKPYTVFVEGAEPSGALNDLELTLELQGGTALLGKPVSGKLTSVRLKLEICKCRVDAATKPTPFAAADKIEKGRYLHVQDAALQHERARLIVHRAEPAAFTGKLRLSAWDNTWEIADRRLALFDTEQPAKDQRALGFPYEIPTPAHQLPADGQEFWIEGKEVSEELRDAAIQLGLADLDERFEGDRVNVTVIETSLRICQSKTKADEDPAPMSAEDQLKKGRFLHQQDPGFHHGRALVLVKQVKPAAFAGKLTLTVWDVTAKSAADPRIELFKAEDEVAAAGQTAKANPFEFDHDGSFPAKGLKLWAQGKNGKVSAALRDTEIRLGVKDHIAVCGRAAVTVVAFTKLTVTIKPTPANTVRTGHAAPANHTHEVTDYEEDFTKDKTLVLLRNAQPDIALEVITKPDRPIDLPVLWKAVRNKDDHATLGDAQALPTITADRADCRKATLSANEKGAFHIRPYIDCNGVDEYSPGEPSLPLSLVLANVTVAEDNSAGLNGNLKATGTAGRVDVRNGTWPDTWAAATQANGAGMTMELVAEVTGGGVDGRIGLDRVFGGLVNMLRGNEIRLTYRDATRATPVDYTVRNRYVLNKGAATGNYGGSKMFKPTDPAPNLLSFPVLDTGRRPGGLGGETAVMGRSGVWDTPPADAAVGKRYTLRCIDSPGRGFLQVHPDHPNALLAQIHYVQQFRANFCFWTNIARVRGQSADPANRVYSVVRTMNWDVTADWDVDSSAATPVLTVSTPHAVAVSDAATIDPLGRAQDHGVEVRPPSGITDAIAWETT